MNDGKDGMSCGLGCWALAAGVGLVAFLMLLVLGDQGWIASIFLSGVAFVVLGLLFSRIFCSDLPKPGEVKPGEDRGLRAVPPSADDAAPAPASAAPAPAAAGAPAEASAVKPSTPLPGEADLASRKGEWTYGGDAPAAAEGEGAKPEALSAPRDGGADDLKKIKGIGPKLEQVCNSLGFYHFDQIANWTADEVAWVDQNLEGFKGRVTRDDWVAQAKTLASGGETDFSKRVDDGDVY
ncbi:endonuclease [Aestuariicoccus sp. MJ-SS9]|uniref:endonuclease n=1 Tax=Aestuariicoccus sp. MJ-SS9 TaxID=3079855 RepID=UPI00290C3325|nr:endonuclease [Aestuariicoccus sp. MJ-SS9]MDU8910554.1 endonuclease [Aestuariicoccus sp. MJ-SS9]